jgi:hypothetical protein
MEVTFCAISLWSKPPPLYKMKRCRYYLHYLEHGFYEYFREKSFPIPIGVLDHCVRAGATLSLFPPCSLYPSVQRLCMTMSGILECQTFLRLFVSHLSDIENCKTVGQLRMPGFCRSIDLLLKIGVSQNK